jgi:hypothetical protein
MNWLVCLFLARNGHGAMSALSPLSGIKRKSDLRGFRSAFDRGCVKRARAKDAQICFLNRQKLPVQLVSASTKSTRPLAGMSAFLIGIAIGYAELSRREMR